MSKRLLSSAVAALMILASGVQPVAAGGPSNSGGLGTPKDLSTQFHGARIALHSATGAVRMVGGSVRHPAVTRAELGGPANANAAATAFLQRNAGLFGISDPQADLQLAKRQDASRGRTILRYQQLYHGIPVIAGDLVVDVSKRLDIVSANGEASPQLNVATHPTVAAATAKATAVAAVAKADGKSASGLSATEPALWIYDTRLMGTPGAPVIRLVWRLDVTAGTPTDLDELVLIDAQKGGVLVHFNQIDTAAPDRIVCDRNNVRHALVTCGTGSETPVIASNGTGYGVPVAGSDAQRAFDYSGNTWTYYFNRFGRDSLNGAGLQLKSTVRFCDTSGGCPYANAFWNSTQMVYGQSFAAGDDVDGHELTHGFTEFTSHLFYWYQSGAINEAMSDIMGEFIDQDFNDAFDNDSPSVKWLLGEDIPGYPSGIRNMMNPPASAQGAQPDKMTSFFYYAPTSPYGVGDNGGVHYNSGVANKAAYLLGEDPSSGPITFNSVTVTPIGRDKTAALFYEVDANLLTSGADYADLGTDMQQACQNLLASTPKNISGGPSASGPFTAANCTQVGNAVTATEMALTPTVAGAAYPEAPICPVAKPGVLSVFTENAEYTQAQVDAHQVPWDFPANARWGLTGQYATSVDKHALYHSFVGADVGFVSDSSLAMHNAVVIPSGGYLRFNHSYVFDYGGEYFPATGDFYDGGRVEYTTDGTTWNDLGPLITDNGYNGTLYTGFGNPLAGQQAFTGSSKGYYSSRADLSTLAGQSVKFRWRAVSGNHNTDLGWLLDDISIYSCAAPTLSINDASVTEGNSGSVNAAFTVSLSAASGSTVTVHYATADGTANQPSDYTSTSGDLSFAPGETSKPVNVPVVGDTLAEANETFTVNLSTPANASIADGQGVGTIVDDDSSPTDTTGPTVGMPTVDIILGRLGATGSRVPIQVSFTATDPSGVATTRLRHRFGRNPFSNVSLPSPNALTTALKLPASDHRGHRFQASATDTLGNATIGPKARMHVRLRQDTATAAAGVQFIGAWSSVTNKNASGGSLKSSRSAGASVSLTLAGVTDFAWVSSLGANRGMADVYVDGVKQATVDLYSATTTYRQVVFTWDSGGAPGTHTIQIRVLGTKNASSLGTRVDLDTFAALTN